jgi:hypothetical protein
MHPSDSPSQSQSNLYKRQPPTTVEPHDYPAAEIDDILSRQSQILQASRAPEARGCIEAHHGEMCIDVSRHWASGEDSQQTIYRSHSSLAPGHSFIKAITWFSNMVRASLFTSSCILTPPDIQTIQAAGFFWPRSV